MIGREFAMTVFRQWAKRQGVVIAAGGAGKLKAVFQNIFVGAIILWFAFRDARKPLGWETQPLRLLLEPVPRRLRRGDAGDRGRADGVLLRASTCTATGPSSPARRT